MASGVCELRGLEPLTPFHAMVVRCCWRVSASASAGVIRRRRLPIDADGQPSTSQRLLTFC